MTTGWGTSACVRDDNWAVHLDVTPTEVHPGQSISYSVSLDVAGHARAGDHVVRLEVYDPADRLVLAHTRNILTQAGRVKGTIPIALNAPTGVWRLKAIDTISGRTNETRVALRAARRGTTR